MAESTRHQFVDLEDKRSTESMGDEMKKQKKSFFSVSASNVEIFPQESHYLPLLTISFSRKINNMSCT